jgi:hypothetical protein
MGWKKSREPETAATALILWVKEGMSYTTARGITGRGQSVRRYHVGLRVAPATQPPFEVEITTDSVKFHGEPMQGQTIAVFYDPAKPSDVVVDHQARVAEMGKMHAVDRERRDVIRAERRAQGLPPIEATDGPDPVIVARLTELQARKDRGELSDYEFRMGRVQIMKDAGF